MVKFQGFLGLMALLALSRAAPLDKGAGLNKNVNDVEEQEEELQSLLHLADEQSKQSDVTVHEVHMQHAHEVNGHKVEVDTARKTVSDTASGQVLSDVKQEVTKGDDSAGAAQPDVEVKTEVDVPAEGVHETIVQSGSEAEEPTQTEPEMEQAEAEEGMEYSPEAVAEELYQTGDINRFYAALAQLVNASIMTEQEANAYAQLVFDELDRMQKEDYENSILLQRRAPPAMLEPYPAMMENPDLYPLALDPSLPMEGYPVPMETGPEALYGIDPEPQVKDMQGEFDPYELLYALWNEAYGSGDVRAEALVSDLFEKVRYDSDPDDEGQVRDILLDLIANSLADEDESNNNNNLPPLPPSLPQMPPQQPFYSWPQPINNVDANFMQQQQPMRNIIAAAAAAAGAGQAQPMEEDEEAANELLGQNQVKRTANENQDDEIESESEETKPLDSTEGEKEEEEEEGEKEEEKEEEEEGEKEAEEELSEADAPLPAEKRAKETV